MPMDFPTLRKLLSLDPDDPLSRFALGRRLAEEPDAAAQAEAIEHLRFANARDPGHLATYHVLGQLLIRVGRVAEARDVLTRGLERTQGLGEGMGRDLGPAMQALLAAL